MIKALWSSATASPWYPVAKLGLVVLVLLGVWLHGRSSGVQSERKGWEAKVVKAERGRIARYEAELTKLRQTAQVDQAAARELAQQVETARAEAAKLAATRIPLVRTVKVPVNVEGQCSCPVLSGAFGVCASAAVSGSPADSSACQARAGDGSTGSRRGL